jgi:hemerythrin-like domain-containing protein
MMTAIDVLLDEHRTIEAMLEVLLSAAARLAAGAAVPRTLVAELVDFFERFADRVHHAKEEAVLFPVLAAWGLGPESTPIAALLSQHDTGRGYVREMRQALGALAEGRPDAGPRFAASARDYADLIREHIRIEDHYFQTVAAEHLDPETDRRLLDQMATVDREADARAAQDRRELLARYREAVARW